LFDESTHELRDVLRIAQDLRARGLLVALERRARSPGAQRAALEKQGYDGVATVGVEGVEYFSERALRLKAESRE
jgi:hypothetical protein